MQFVERDRPSDSPLAMEVPNAGTTVRRGGHRSGRRERALPLYIGAVLSFGLLLAGIIGTVVTRPQDRAEATAPSANAITDTVVHLHARDLAPTCWNGLSSTESVRLTVAMEVGIDGKIRYATASGSTPELEDCVESHVRSWEFLTQARAQTMALPFEVDRL